MSEHPHIKNIFEPGMGGGFGGGGLGAGVLGGALSGLLFNNRNFGHEGVVTPAQLTTAIAGIEDSQQNTAIMSGIGDIKAAVPLAEAQTQLALSQGLAALTAQANTNLATLLQSESAIKESVASYGTANLSATKDAAYATAAAIRDDGDKTRALITSQFESTLQRQLAVAEAALAEQRSVLRSKEVEVNVTQSVDQRQIQVQAQAQAQAQTSVLNQICHVLSGLQNAVATNSNLIVGNSGAVATGVQSAAPVNVRA